MNVPEDFLTIECSGHRDLSEHQGVDFEAASGIKGPRPPRVRLLDSSYRQAPALSPLALLAVTVTEDIDRDEYACSRLLARLDALATRIHGRDDLGVEEVVGRLRDLKRQKDSLSVG